MPSSRRPAPSPRALILAAGVGRRLGNADPDQPEQPKALLEFDGSSLLARHVTILRRLGVTDITVVTGFGAPRILAALAALDGTPPVATVANPDFREGSVVSLWAGRDVLRSAVPVILMDADVLVRCASDGSAAGQHTARLPVARPRDRTGRRAREAVRARWPHRRLSQATERAARLARRIGRLFPVLAHRGDGTCRPGRDLRHRRAAA